MQRLLHAYVPMQLILLVAYPMVPVHLAPTPANALHFLISSLCSQFVGHPFAIHANRLILAEIAEVPVQLLSDVGLNVRVNQDLVISLETRYCPSQDHADEDEPAPKRVKVDKGSRD